jgi:hypothetical protein
MEKLFKTKNDLSEEIRVKAVNLLNARLADAIDLQTQTKQAHWNVKGPTFIALHELFDKINEDVEDYVDAIAERGVQLGGVAVVTSRRTRRLWRHSENRRARPSTIPTTSAISTLPTCLRRFCAALTSGCGSFTLRRKFLAQPLRDSAPDKP